jgi:hypothetical protein
MRRDRYEEFRHEIAVRGVGKGVPIVAAVSSRAVAKLGLTPMLVRKTGEQADFDESGVVEGVVELEFEFVLDRKRRQLFIRRDGAEIWNDIQDSLEEAVLSLSCVAA